MTGLRIQTRRWRGKKAENDGFALPTILIMSIVLLAIGVSTLQVGAAISRSLVDQHWNRLAKSAGQSGVAFATSCVKNGTSTWPSVITPNKKCDAATLSPDPGIYISSDTSANASPSRWRSTYTIAVPVVGGDGISRVKVTGVVETLTSGNIPTKTYAWDYNVVLGGGGSSKIILSLSVDYQTICALASDYKVYCSGWNVDGRIGDGTTTTPRSPPVQFQLPVGKTAFALDTPQKDANTYEVCALTTDQLAYCAGDNFFGQLGDGTTTNRSTPVQFQLPAGKTAAAIDSNRYDNCALTNDQLVYCAGYNAEGQLGDTTFTNRSTPVQFQVPGGKKVWMLDNNMRNSCVVAVDQLVYCAGYNAYGQLGDASLTNRATPVLFQLPAGKTAVDMKADSLITCALTSDQLVYCAGYNANGQLGDGTTTSPRSTPVLFQLPAGKSAIAMSSNIYYQHMCVLTNDQQVYCSGYNGYGQLGDTTTTDRSTAVRFQLPAGKLAASVHIAANHTCVLTVDQLIYCAGDGREGRLGNGTNVTTPTPTLYQLPAGKTPKSIIIGTYITCVLTTDQLAYCAGENYWYQLGNGTNIDALVPIQYNVP